MRLKFLTPLAFAALAIQTHAEGNLELTNTQDKASYAIGQSIGRDMHERSFAVNPDAMVASLKDALTDAKPRLAEKDCKEALTVWQKEQTEKFLSQRKEAGEKNKKEGEKFLADNKTKEGVKALPSGIQYKVLKEGKGASPKATSTVKTQCRGTLIDGTEFFSTYKDNEPATFPVKEVIKGWSEVLPLMKVGSKWQVVVPAELAYGEKGAGTKVGPNSTLIFEIELLSIES
jgi:FKBP-type peptidyl-prolyl cis-trans isomerase FklB